MANGAAILAAMSDDRSQQVPRRVLVVMPSWVGDMAMATPTLRALRESLPSTHITALARRAVRPILDACPWVDRIITVRPRGGKPGRARGSNVFAVARRLAAGRFDLAVLLPNSFRWALAAKLARIKRIVGYDRDGRGFLLTDRLTPLRGPEGFVPEPALDYYLRIAAHLGAVEPGRDMQLFTRLEHDAVADRILAGAGATAPPPGRPLVLLSPGAGYGPAKLWPAERFAAVADRCVRECGAAVAVTGAPAERSILDQVVAAAAEPILDLAANGVDLRLLKSVVKRSSLMIVNDTGPRHIAAAFGVPVVSIFGPTDPAWTEIGFDRERQVRVPVFCGPCQKKVCPLDHRCMTQVTVAMVFEQAAGLLAAGPAQPTGGAR